LVTNKLEGIFTFGILLAVEQFHAEQLVVKCYGFLKVAHEQHGVQQAGQKVAFSLVALNKFPVLDPVLQSP